MMLVLSNDLMFGSQSSQAASSVGMESQVFSSSDALLSSVAGGPNSTEDRSTRLSVVIDLTMPGLNVDELANQLSQTDRTLRRIAIGPHVHTDRLDRAREAGWEVFTRGQFHAGFAQIMADE